MPLMRRVVRVLGAVVAVVALALAWARFVEPRWLQVTHHRLDAPVSPPVKVAHVSDLHSSGLGALEQSLLDALEEEKPDLIVVSGDSVGEHGVPDAVLGKLSAPLGVYLVNGNHEHWRDYQPPGALLVNASAQVREGLWVVGLDDAMAGQPSLATALEGVPDGGFRIGLFHSPALFDEVSAALPVSFAGHTHGGQVRVPFLPPLWLPPRSGRYTEGWYERGGAKLYVSRGVGTTILPLRFWCRPELAIVTLGK